LIFHRLATGWSPAACPISLDKEITMTATTRASSTLIAVAAIVSVMIVAGAAGALAQNTNGGRGPFMQRGGPPQGGPDGPGGRFGRGGRGGPMGALGPIMRQANLTDAQRDQVRSIVESHRNEMQALAERARPAHEALQAALTSGTVDEATIRAKSAEIASVDVEMAVAQARIYAEVFQILTPEQQALVKKQRAIRD
jgi:Spy/CpxP family protein refolding chaperone